VNRTEPLAEPSATLIRNLRCCRTDTNFRNLAIADARCTACPSDLTLIGAVNAVSWVLVPHERNEGNANWRMVASATIAVVVAQSAMAADLGLGPSGSGLGGVVLPASPWTVTFMLYAWAPLMHRSEWILSKR